MKWLALIYLDRLKREKPWPLTLLDSLRATRDGNKTKAIHSTITDERLSTVVVYDVIKSWPRGIIYWPFTRHVFNIHRLDNISKWA